VIAIDKWIDADVAAMDLIALATRDRVVDAPDLRAARENSQPQDQDPHLDTVPQVVGRGG